MAEYVLFRVGDLRCGLPIEPIREINKNVVLTAVYTSPDYVRGVLNLRGEIVTVIDMHKLFHLGDRSLNRSMKNIVVRWGEETVGLLVDDVDDIVLADEERIHPAPSHLDSVIRRFTSAVYDEKGELITILDVDKLLAIEPEVPGT